MPSAQFKSAVGMFYSSPDVLPVSRTVELMFLRFKITNHGSKQADGYEKWCYVERLVSDDKSVMLFGTSIVPVC